MQILIHTICMSVCLTIARILSFISGTSIWLYVNGFMLYILYLPSVVCYMPLLVLRMRCAFMSAQKEIYNANKIGNDDDILPTIYYGGYKPRAISYVDIKDYITADEICKGELATSNFQYLDHLDASNSKKYTDKQHIHVHLPLHILAGLVPLGICRSIAAIHDIAAGSHTTLPMMKSLFKEHTCDKCVSCLTIFAMQPSKNQCKKIQRKKAESMKTEEQKDLEREKTRIRVADYRMQKHFDEFGEDLESVFPPSPLNKDLSQKVIESACKKLDPTSFEEAGCAVCGQLTPLTELSRLTAVKNYLKILEAPGITRQERSKISDNIREYPIAIDHSCKKKCNSCHGSLHIGKVPRLALANGLWLGQVPDVLSSL